MGTKIKLISYNIHKGSSAGNLTFTLPQMREELRKLDVDLIFLQEIRGDQVKYLGESFWPHATYGKNAAYAGGDHGNAILSKFPIILKNNINISQNRFEKRGLLHLTVAAQKGGPETHLFCTHLNLLERSRRKQLGIITDYIGKLAPEPERIILAGDFNDWSLKANLYLSKNSNLKEAFTEIHGSAAKTFPAIMPTLRLDRVYSRGFKINASKRLNSPQWKKVSDHLPLFAELQI